MDRGALLTLVLMVSIATVAAPTVAIPAGDAAAVTEYDDDNVSAGERFAGVVGVQQAELDGEMNDRAFDARLSAADGDEAKAAIVAAKLDESRSRLAELEDRKASLTAARENGTITEGEYRARMAAVAAETRTVERTIERSDAVVEELPEEALAKHDVDVDAIATLRNRTGELNGDETAGVARSIAGGLVGHPVAGEATPPADAGREADNESTDSVAPRQFDEHPSVSVDRGANDGQRTERGSDGSDARSGDARSADGETRTANGNDQQTERSSGGDGAGDDGRNDATERGNGDGSENGNGDQTDQSDEGADRSSDQGNQGSGQSDAGDRDRNGPPTR